MTDKTDLTAALNANIQIMERDGTLRVSSREVANNFGKLHRDVLKAIRNLECSEEFGMRNFAQTPYVDPQNGQTYQMYEMTRDGFTFLVMGFTGKDAAVWKEKYIAAFNAMEDRLRNPTAQPEPMSEDQMILTSMQTLVGRVEALRIENHNKDVLIEEMQPKVEEYDAYLDTEGVVTIRDFCNKHQVKVRHPGWALRERGMLHQKRTLATQKGIKSGIIKNIVERNSFEYIDARGNTVEAQSAMVVKQKELELLRMIVSDYGKTAFRNEVAHVRAVKAVKLDEVVA